MQKTPITPQMRCRLLMPLILIYCSLGLATNPSLTAYIDLEDGQRTSVFNKPGFDWQSCPTDQSCKAIGWPDNNAEIRILDSKPTVLKVIDPDTKETTTESYYHISFTYPINGNPKNKTPVKDGWVDADYLGFGKKTTFFGAQGHSSTPDCPKTGNASHLAELAKMIKPIENLGVTKTANEISKLIGKCVLSPGVENQLKEMQGNVYDNLVLKTASAKKLPALLDEAGHQLSSAQLIDIDSMARTIYGEMAGCFKRGLQYPFATARVIFNRLENKDEFIKGPHAANKPDLAKLCTSASQFSVWLTEQNGKPNASLNKALCPPANPKGKYWKGKSPPKFETDIWQNSVRIATEAVLFPKKFVKRTAAVDESHYTSGRSSFYNMRQHHPAVEGRTVENDDCLQLWK